jgi:hypothetical protein
VNFPTRACRGRTPTMLCEFCSTAMLGRGTGDHGELVCVVNLLDCFQMWMRATAGDAGASDDHREAWFAAC